VKGKGFILVIAPHTGHGTSDVEVVNMHTLVARISTLPSAKGITGGAAVTSGVGRSDGWGWVGWP